MCIRDSYDRLLGFDEVVVIGYGTKRINGRQDKGQVLMAETANAAPGINQSKFAPPTIVKDEEKRSDTATGFDAGLNKEPTPTSISIRKNFNETAFFFPDLKTDAEGNVSFSFTIPEALTEWKLMMLTHTK